MSRLGYFGLFLIINFGSLALGSLLMGEGPTSDWYISLNKAPWTPPGWVFGASWTLIMICFSVYLSYLFTIRNSNFVKTLFTIQVVLNISWNFLFFNQHWVLFALINIIMLTLLIIYLFISFGDGKLSKMKYLLLPYIIWLCIATSLNAYIYIYN
ncbi:TspO/MBR family protein [Winogradskyella maritima]|uniref:TspO/MBR family protein n=1 Tax=Winogradskyella maritima TaxID=1517766 RepID=A0ABV8AGI9_9FLAO|nr:TspO/MBR family protein [Winogradskyella maritima]